MMMLNTSHEIQCNPGQPIDFWNSTEYGQYGSLRACIDSSL